MSSSDDTKMYNDGGDDGIKIVQFSDWDLPISRTDCQDLMVSFKQAEIELMERQIATVRRYSFDQEITLQFGAPGVQSVITIPSGVEVLVVEPRTEKFKREFIPAIDFWSESWLSSDISPIDIYLKHNWKNVPRFIDIASVPLQVCVINEAPSSASGGGGARRSQIIKRLSPSSTCAPVV